jgi:pyridoxine kinase
MSILILSSLVAASRVGGSAQAAALERMGLETIFLPTVLFGRHPGLGPPGGAPTPQDTLEGMIEGVAASGALAGVEVMITGYFASAAQVEVGARLIDVLRRANRAARILVDPIMGDEGRGLYVKDEVAELLPRLLVPRADVLAPNAWELARLSRRTVNDAAAARAAAQMLGCTVLASSIPVGDEIGVLLASSNGAFLARHQRLPEDPKGAGDLLAAVFAGSLAQGRSEADALAAATAETAALVAGHEVEIVVERLDG